MTMFGKVSRSPISTKALTLAELRQIPLKTDLILFYWPNQARTPVKVMNIYSSQDGPMVTIRYTTGQTETWDAETLGLVPMLGAHRRAPRTAKPDDWHDSYCMVRPADVGTLPKTAHWSAG